MHKIGKVIFIVVVILLAVIAGVLFVAHHYGYLPVFLDVEPPAGNYEELTPLRDIDLEVIIDEISEEEEISCELMFGILIQEIPKINDLTYQLYETDVLPSVVLEDYDSKLKDKGYALYKEGMSEYYSYEINYVVYLKGATAVGILTTPRGCCSSCVFYSTGFVLTYQSIYNQLEEKFV